MYIPEYFEWWHIPVVFIAGLIGESYGSIIGGGGIVIQACLIFLGLPPHSVVAVDNAGALGSELGILSVTWKKILQKRKFVALLTIAISIGGVAGTHFFINLNPKQVEYLMIAIVTLLIIYSFFKKPKKFEVSHKHYFALFIIFIFLGFYNNVIGMGEGTFGRLALMSLLGINFIECQGLKTIGSIPVRIYSWIITASLGMIIYPYLITLLIANFIAGHYASKFIHLVPQKLMMQTLTIVAISFVAYLLFT